MVENIRHKFTTEQNNATNLHQIGGMINCLCFKTLSLKVLK